ncbi:hypothetical protein JCM3765_000169 [Sporobolomyces pararoseus]
MGADSDYVGKVIKEVARKLKEKGLETVRLTDWQQAMISEVESLASRRRHPNSHNKYRRKADYVLKEMLAYLENTPESVLDSNNDVVYDWSPLAIQLRVLGEGGREVPQWVEGHKEEFNARSFTWNRKDGLFEYVGHQNSIGKNAFRINSRHAQMYAVSTYGQHPSGGQRF